MSLVKSSVSSVSFAWGSPEFVFWRTPFYNVEVYVAMVLQLLQSKKIFENIMFPLSIFSESGGTTCIIS